MNEPAYVPSQERAAILAGQKRRQLAHEACHELLARYHGQGNGMIRAAIVAAFWLGYEQRQREGR